VYDEAVIFRTFIAGRSRRLVWRLPANYEKGQDKAVFQIPSSSNCMFCSTTYHKKTGVARWKALSRH